MQPQAQPTLLTENRKSLIIFPPIKKVKCPYTLYVVLDVKGYAEIKHYEKKSFQSTIHNIQYLNSSKVIISLM